MDFPVAQMVKNLPAMKERESGVPGGRGGGKDNWERKHTDIECPHARL